MNWGCSQRCSTVGRRGSSRMGRPPSRARAVQITKRNNSGSSFWKKIQTKDEVLAELMAEHIALKKVLGSSDQSVGTARYARRAAGRNPRGTRSQAQGSPSPAAAPAGSSIAACTFFEREYNDFAR